MNFSNWCNCRLPNRLSENQDAEPEIWSHGGRVDVQEQLGLLQEGHSSRRGAGAVSRPWAPAGGRLSREGHQAYGTYFITRYDGTEKKNGCSEYICCC